MSEFVAFEFIDSEEEKIRVDHFPDPNQNHISHEVRYGLFAEFWRMRKRNIDFHEAPSAARLHKELRFFLDNKKCGCCFFTFTKTEFTWVKDKIDAGLGLMRAVSSSTLRRIDFFQNPHKHPFEALLEEGPRKWEEKIEITRPSGEKEWIDDPLLWTFKDEDGKYYWRDEGYDPIYIPAIEFADVLGMATNNLAIDKDDPDTQFGLTPTQIGAIWRVIDALHQISKLVHKDQSAYTEWVATDMHPDIRDAYREAVAKANGEEAAPRKKQETAKEMNF